MSTYNGTSISGTQAISGTTTISEDAAYFTSSNSAANCVTASHTATTGTNTAIKVTLAGDGAGVYVSCTATSGQAIGVESLVASPSGYAVYGANSATSGVAYGVVGQTASTAGYAGSFNATATTGSSYGVQAIAQSTAGTAVLASATATTGTNYGLYAKCASASAYAVYGVTTATSDGVAIFGSGSNDGGYGVLGTGFHGVHGIAYINGTDSVGVWGEGAPNGYAMWANGLLAATSKSFMIDHPVDPENMWLCHSCVESPDMKNVYDGTCIADSRGEATVQLPSYFEALNDSFRYQLTAMGGPAPNLHIKAQINGSQFVVSGANPGQEISWQVTGVRKDPYAVAHRIIPERAKGAADRGRYKHPELYGTVPSRNRPSDDTPKP